MFHHATVSESIMSLDNVKWRQEEERTDGGNMIQYCATASSEREITERIHTESNENASIKINQAASSANTQRADRLFHKHSYKSEQGCQSRLSTAV